MPAVSVCDPLSMSILHNLETAGQSKSSDELNNGLAINASRILHTEIDYEETENYRSSVQDCLKSKYIVLNLPKQETSDNGKMEEGAACSKVAEKNKEPRLPEPVTTLYPADKVTLGWNTNLPVGAGMYNVGNTCYLNSTLQALFHVPALVNWLLSDTHHHSKCEQNVRDRFFLDAGGECLTCAVAKTLQFSHEKSGDSIKPFSVYNKLKLICRTMVPGQQEDAHEFLRYLLEGMEKAYLARHKAQKLDNYSKETTPINQIFGGYIRTEVKCLQCRHVSTTFQHFQDLLLDIRKASTLDEALAGYFSQEQLDNNDYKCEACKRRVPATKQFILERPPKVLCVQLKRFSVMGGKISRHVGFKQTIDMGPYIRRQPGEPPSKLVYRLASMVTHMGPSVNCGHYTAVAQVSSNKFYSFDDSCVRQIGLANVVNTNAYIMIFEMEPPSKLNGQSHGSQLINTKTDTPALKFPHINGITSKLMENAGTKPTTSSNKSSGNESPSKQKEKEGAETPPPPPQPPLMTANHVRRSIIGPQLPPEMEKNRQYELANSGKLVEYDACSSDDNDNGSSNNILKISREDREIRKSASSSSSPITIKTNGNPFSVQTSRSPSIHNGNTHYLLSNGLNANSGGSESSNDRSSRGSSPKNGSTNGKSEYNNDSPSENEKRRHAKSRDIFDRTISTKASSSSNSNKGWKCKDSSSSVWSVSDNLSNESSSNSNRANNPYSTPAEMRCFNGTNRSDTVSHLQKSSQWGLGNCGVNSWNGSKSRIDRDVDNDRRQMNKRSYNDDDDQHDRGRTKKIKKPFSRFDNNSLKFNHYQEYHNKNTKWKSNNHRNNNDYHKGHQYRSKNFRYNPRRFSNKQSTWNR